VKCIDGDLDVGPDNAGKMVLMLGTTGVVARLGQDGIRED